ncbi:hypothetical protein E0L93_07715 [Rubrobacter taiwanensis]|uniref:Regulatory protein RecX n=1 Tax=Rubrobacter taiwanensis TaxID=185139 RepID=A0A4V2NWA8_9ACTN|nr:RecX family transcriptional regulator [Rubrobacter taiwanensis]TCJ16622.1 hypothetical protein E0L93_07715 [Rubrobacter taiwanensis]
MPRITRAVRRRRGLLTVYVDGEYWKTLDAGAAEEHGILEGAELSTEELQRAGESAEYALALRRAMDFLSYHTRSEGEVRARLRRFGHAERAIERSVARLRELDYLNDREFARALVRRRAGEWGRRRLHAELRKRGVPEETAAAAIEEQLGGRPELEDARNLAKNKYNTEERSESQARRVYQFLARRGYSAEVCAAVAREYLSG